MAMSRVLPFGQGGYPIQGLGSYDGTEEKKASSMRFTSEHSRPTARTSVDFQRTCARHLLRLVTGAARSWVICSPSTQLAHHAFSVTTQYIPNTTRIVTFKDRHQRTHRTRKVYDSKTILFFLSIL